jgi:NAD+ synthase
MSDITAIRMAHFTHVWKIYEILSYMQTKSPMPFTKDILAIDAMRESERIAERVRTQVLHVLRKRGAVVAVSGGLDSAACAALCTLALGKERVLALLLPERHSSPESTRLGNELASALGIRVLTHEISTVLESAGCYRAQQDVVRSAFPDATAEWTFKITMPSLIGQDRLNMPRLTVRTPGGETLTERLSHDNYLTLVAATNFKQRIRTMQAYFHADAENFAVCGTPNRLEYDQGFFVKGGDGLADFKPIAHLYKSQVRAVAAALGVPREIIARTPTTDTFPLSQGQDEFFFGVPHDVMDLCLYGCNNGYPPAEVAQVLQLDPAIVERIYRDIAGKRRTTLPLHLPALLVDDIPEITSLKERALCAELPG